MDQQTTSMIKDAKLYQEKGTWFIIWTYELSRYFLTIDNTFTEEYNPLKFKYELDAKTYLAVLKDNL